MSIRKTVLLFIGILAISESVLCHAQTATVAVSVEDEKLLGRLQTLLASENLNKRLTSGKDELNKDYIDSLETPLHNAEKEPSFQGDHDSFKRRMKCLCWARFQMVQEVLAYANTADALGGLKFDNADSVWEGTPDSPVEYLWLGANSLSLSQNLADTSVDACLQQIQGLELNKEATETQVWQLLKKQAPASLQNSLPERTKSREIREIIGFNPELLLSSDPKQAAALIEKLIDYHAKTERNITSPTDFRGFLRLLSITRTAVELGASQHLKKETLTALTRLIVSDFSKYEFFGGHVYLEQSWTPESSQHLIPLICTRILQHLRSIYVPQIVCYPNAEGQATTLFIDLGVKQKELSNLPVILCNVEAEERSRVLPVFLPQTNTTAWKADSFNTRFKKVDLSPPASGCFQVQLPSYGLCSYPKQIPNTNPPQ